MTGAMMGAESGPTAFVIQDDRAERVVLVDGDDRETGTAPKLLAHRQGLRHRAFSVLVRDGEGRVLLQRRASGKYHSGGLWSNSCCGHPRPGEGTAAAAARRLEEEMGIRCDLTYLGRICYGASFANGLTENEVVSVYGARHAGPVQPNPEEVEDVVWLSPSALLADVRRHPDSYTAWFRIYLDDHLPVLGLRD
jgi:isopentenyl-diphosphate delta-isomerase